MDTSARDCMVLFDTSVEGKAGLRLGQRCAPSADADG